MATLKNTIINDTSALYLPTGTTAQRPATPVDGDTRFNTDTGILEYYYRGFWVDSRTGAGAPVWAGCVCYINPGIAACYPGSGTTLTDLTGNANNFTMSASGLTYSSANGGKFTGTTSGYIRNSGYNLSGAGALFSIVVVTRYSGASKGRILTGYNNNWLLGHHGGYNGGFYSEGWVTSGSGTAPNTSGNTEWHVHACTGDQTNDRWAYFKNGGLVARNNAGSAGPNGLQLNPASSLGASGGGAGENSDWEFSMLMIYNRVLTDDEMKQTAGAIKLRNGF